MTSLSRLESQKAKKGIGYSSRGIISIPPSYTALFHPMLKNPGIGSKLKVFIDNASYPKWTKSSLEQARKFRVGLILGHQHLDQFERKLRSTVMTNTAIKLVGGISEADARALAGNMGCTPEFLLEMKKYEAAKITQFACWVRNHTSSAIRLNVPLGMMEELPKIHPQVFATLIRCNREQYCTE